MKIKDVPIEELNPSEYNPRALTEKEYKDLEESLKRFDFVEPIVVNSAENRKNIVIGGHQRLIVAKELGYRTIPVSYVKITKLKKEQELNLRLNKNLGHFDYDLLADFDEEMLVDVGFTKEELLENFSLNEAERVLFEENRLEVIMVEAPEAIRLKARQVFYCGSIEEFERIKEYFKTNREGYLDKIKLMGLMGDDKVF